MANTNKIEGFAIITSIGAACGGPQEVTVAYLRMVGDLTNKVYRWVGGIKIDVMELKSGQQIHIRAFVRPDGMHLYHVKATV